MRELQTQKLFRSGTYPRRAKYNMPGSNGNLIKNNKIPDCINSNNCYSLMNQSIPNPFCTINNQRRIFVLFWHNLC